MSVLVFGRTGQVGRELAACVPDAIFPDRAQADLGAPESCAAVIARARPAAVINAAAYTAVDRAETDAATALAINATAPGVIARTCADLGIPLVHISTDYVFDGTGRHAFAPGAPPGPLNAYGRSKLAGEEAVRAAGGSHAILRTSWVFSAHGTNFLKTMLRLSETRDHLSVVEDQVGGPTPADAIARACLAIAADLGAAPEKTGTYHLSGASDTSWKGFAEAIFAAARRPVRLEGIASADYPTPAARPLNSRLDCTTLKTVFGIGRPDWRQAVADIVKELT